MTIIDDTWFERHFGDPTTPTTDVGIGTVSTEIAETGADLVFQWILEDNIRTNSKITETDLREIV